MAFAIRAEHDVACFDSLGYSPERTTGESRADLSFFWILGEIDWNELFVKLPPLFWKFPAKVLMNSEVCANETARETFSSVHAFASEHDSVIAFQGFSGPLWVVIVERWLLLCAFQPINNWRAHGAFSPWAVVASRPTC